MSNKELKQLLDILAKAGVTHYKTPELELSLEPIPQSTQAIDQALKDLPGALNTIPTLNGKQLTEDDLINWSSGH